MESCLEVIELSSYTLMGLINELHLLNNENIMSRQKISYSKLIYCGSFDESRISVVSSSPYSSPHS